MTEEDNSEAIAKTPGHDPLAKAASNETLFVELYREAGSQESKTNPTTAAIALFVLEDTLSTAENRESSKTDSRFTLDEMRPVQVEKAINFFTVSDSGTTTPECAVRRCEMVIMRDLGDMKDRQERRGSCYLLEYRMDWEVGQNTKIIEISAPSSL